MATTMALSITLNNTPSTSELPENSTADQVVAAVWIYISPIILFTGLVGNTLNILVLRRKRFIESTISIYLPLIALSDNLELILGIIPEWLEATQIVVFSKIHPWTCKTEKFFFYTFGDIAIWLLTAFTFDRFCAICFPFFKQTACSHRKVWVACGGIALAAVLKNIMVFWTRGKEVTLDEMGNIISVDNCGYPSATAEYLSRYVRPWIAFALVNVVPFILIISFNIAIVRTLLVRQDIISAPGGGKTDSFKRPQTAIMCISVSLLFLVTITPSMVLLIGKPYWDEKSSSYKISKAIANLVVYLNHSLNFFMYCLSGTRFRGELVAMCKPTPDSETRRQSCYDTSGSMALAQLRPPIVHDLSTKKEYGSIVNRKPSPPHQGYINGAVALEDEVTRL